jgi:hypothetical protein
VRLCPDVRPDGVYCGKDYSPQCVNETRCAAIEHCFWRGFHMLPAHKYVRKPETAQKELFA